MKCKRRGLKVTLTVKGKSGEGLLRRIQHGPDPVKMLDAALQEAAGNAGVALAVQDGEIRLTLPD